MKGYVIYLPKSEKSKNLAEYTKQHLEPVIDVDLHVGTDRYEVWEKYLKSEFFIQDVSRFGAGLVGAEIATFFSHYKLWLKSYKSNKSFFIFEHDARLKKDFDLNAIKNFSGDILNLGIPNWGRAVHQGKGIIKRKICDKLHNIHRPEHGECTCSTQWLFGAHAYYITPSGAKKLVNQAKYEGILPADTFIRQEVVDIYDLLPLSFEQEYSPSLIQFSDNSKKEYIHGWDY